MPACAASGASIDVSGSVDYAGSIAGPLFVVVSDQSFGGGSIGGTVVDTSGSPPWRYVVRGLPRTSGGFIAKAYIDAPGIQLVDTATDPFGSASFTLSGASATHVDVTLADPNPGVPPVPSIQAVFHTGSQMGVLFAASKDGNGYEVADSYRVYWDTAANPGPLNHLGVTTIMAGSNFVAMSPFTPGTTYYFGVSAVAGGQESAVSSILSAVAGTPTGGSSVSGSVAFSGIPVTASSALFVVLYNGQTGLRVQTIPSPASAQGFTISGVPDGSYREIAFLDLDGDGRLGATDPRTPFDSAPVVVVSGADVTGQSMTIPSSASVARVATEHFVDSGGDQYALEFQIQRNRKVPVSAVLCSGPNVVTPSDMTVGPDNDGGVGERWNLGSTPPATGDEYVVVVTYADGTTENLGVAVTAVLPDAPTMLAPATTTTETVPTFSWSLPGSLPLAYEQMVDVWQNGNRYWEDFSIPAGVTSIAYGADGTASPASLPTGSTYTWQITAQDLLGNRVTREGSFAVVAP